MIVLDASAAMAMAARTEKGKALSALVLDDEKIIAPDLYQTEVANACWKTCAFGGATQEGARKMLGAAIELVDDFCPTLDLLVESYEEACANHHPVYDMVYLVLARRTGATLFTLDRKLVALCEGLHVACIVEEALDAADAQAATADVRFTHDQVFGSIRKGL